MRYSQKHSLVSLVNSRQKGIRIVKDKKERKGAKSEVCIISAVVMNYNGHWVEHREWRRIICISATDKVYIAISSIPVSEEIISIDE